MTDVLGTTGNDDLRGTAADETLQGLAGNDTLDGAAGEDTLRGGPGNDLLIIGGGGVVEHYDGGTGDDTLLADLSTSTNPQNYTLFVDFPSGRGGAVETERGRDTFENIETYEFRGIWDARITGDGGDNELISDKGDDTLDGGDGTDRLESGDGADQLDGGAGSDGIDPGLGADSITTGADWDVIQGTTAELDGDTVTDFSAEDMLLVSTVVEIDLTAGTVTPSTIPPANVRFDGATNALSIDGDADGTFDATVTLQGLGEGTKFTTLTNALGTFVQIDPEIPTLADGQSVAEAKTNGVMNPVGLTSVLSGQLMLKLDAAAKADYDNAIGVYEYDDTGAITNVRIVVASAKDTPSTEVLVSVGDTSSIGLFVVQDGAAWAKALANGAQLSFQGADGSNGSVRDTNALSLMVDGTAAGVNVFHAGAPKLNADGREHAVSWVNSTGDGLMIGMEDMSGGGDRDFQDLLIEIKEAPFQSTNPGQTVDTTSDGSDQTITTGEKDDTVATGGGNDTIDGGAGNDVIRAGGGNDQITLGDGDDAVFGGDGNDVFIAGQAGGQDFIDGGAGDDRVEYPSVPAGTSVNIDLSLQDRSADPAVAAILSRPEVNLPTDTPVGRATIGNDPSMSDVLLNIENATGGAGDDEIQGSATGNLLDGAGGSDVLNGRAGDDTLRGADGNDSLNGGEDSDELVGGAGDDALDGGVGFDRMILQGSRTDYSWQSNTDGSYTVTDSVANRDGVDTVRSVEQVVFADATVGIWTVAGRFDFQGTSASEELVGSDARDNLFGLDGDDTLVGLGEEDNFIGGRGNDVFFARTKTPDTSRNEDWDIVRYDSDYRDGQNAGQTVSGVTVNLGTGTATDPWGDIDTLNEVVRIFATDAGDNLTGSSDTDAFDPFGGNDTIDGGAGWDYLHYHLTTGASRTNGVTAAFSDTTEGSGTVSNDGFGGTDVFSGIEVLRATPLDDRVTGGLGVQEIRGYAGNDTLDGGAGADRISYHDAANYNGFGNVSIDLETTNADGFTTLTDPHGDTVSTQRNLLRLSC